MQAAATEDAGRRSNADTEGVTAGVLGEVPGILPPRLNLKVLFNSLILSV